MGKRPLCQFKTVCCRDCGVQFAVPETDANYETSEAYRRSPFFHGVVLDRSIDSEVLNNLEEWKGYDFGVSLEGRFHGLYVPTKDLDPILQRGQVVCENCILDYKKYTHIWSH
jgi:hypothetical protein